MAVIVYSTGRDASMAHSTGVDSMAHSTGRNASIAHQVSICELLDRVLNKGAVLQGEIVISVADIPLLYVGLNLLIGSVETLLEAMERPTGRGQTNDTF